MMRNPVVMHSWRKHMGMWMINIELERHTLVIDFYNWRLLHIASMKRGQVMVVEVVIKSKAHLIHVIGYNIWQCSPV